MKNLYSDMFSAFQPIIEKRMLKLINFDRDYRVKGVGTSESKLANQSSKENKGSNGGCECGNVPSAGGKVVMQRVGICNARLLVPLRVERMLQKLLVDLIRLKVCNVNCLERFLYLVQKLWCNRSPHLRPLNHLQLLAT